MQFLTSSRKLTTVTIIRNSNIIARKEKAMTKAGQRAKPVAEAQLNEAKVWSQGTLSLGKDLKYN